MTEKGKSFANDVICAVERAKLDELRNYYAFYPEIIYAQGVTGGTALHYAVQKGKKTSAQFLLEHGANPNARNFYRETPLHYARTKEMTLLLLKYKADVNAHDDYEQSPLHFASKEGRLAVASVLIESGARINSDEPDDSPLHYARTPEMAKLLVEHGARIEAIGDWDLTPLGYTAGAGLIDVVGYLLEMGACIDGADQDGGPLCAAAKNDLDKARVLLDRGACVNGWQENSAPLILAINKRHYKVVDLLLLRGAQLPVDCEWEDPHDIT